MGGGKGGGSREVADFYLSVDYGIGLGVIDSINEIKIKEKTAVVGPIMEDGTLGIEKKKLFGGDDGEGGIKGVIEAYLGGSTQKMSYQLAARRGKAPNQCPGYRGLAHVFFRGGPAPSGNPPTGNYSAYENGTPITYAFDYATDTLGNVLPGDPTAPEDDPEQTEGSPFNPNQRTSWFSATIGSGKSTRKGFKWTSNNPYHPPVSFNVTACSSDLMADARIWPIIGVTGGVYDLATEGAAFAGGKLDKRKLPDKNPAAMIYDAMVDELDWGMGVDPLAIDTSSFTLAAAALALENFGLSLLWVRESEVGEYIQEILDHIKALLFVSPVTGLWTLKLLRNDYDPDLDPWVLDDSNSTVTSFKRQAWGEVINEIVVSYTDPESEEEETVSRQNAASIAVQGGVNSETRDYHGVRNPWLAGQIADRDLEEVSRVMASAVVYADRRFRNVLPGDLLKVTSTDKKLTEVIFRVMKVGRGSTSERRMKFDVVEDVFSAPRITEITETEEPTDQGDGLPSDPNFVFPMTVPLPLLTQSGISADDLDAQYPRVYTAFIVDDLTSNTTSIIAEADITYLNGSASLGQVAEFPAPAMYGLIEDLPQEATSVIAASVFDAMVDEPLPGDVFIIGYSDAVHEMIMLDTYDSGNDEWTVVRGLWDTVPLEWFAGEYICASPPSAALDSQERVADDTTTYRFRPTTSQGTLESADATPFDFTPTERPHAPFRPADCEIDGNGFADTEYLTDPIPSTITCTWANRNRLSEDAVAARWGGASVTPESGQTTLIRFRDIFTDTIVHEEPALEGDTTVDVDTLDLAGYANFYVEFIAERDGIESVFFASRILRLANGGYGQNYGNTYG